MSKKISKKIVANLKGYENFLKNKLEQSIEENEKFYYYKLLNTSKNLKKGFATKEKLKKMKLMPQKYDYPVGVQLELTARCNQKCIQCYNQSGSEKVRDMISPSDWLKIVKKLSNFPIRDVVISGGEPTLLGKDLIKIMEVFHENGASFRFITNGMLIDEKMIESLSKFDYSFMQFSIDGVTSEIHDHIRGVNGAYDKVINGVLLAKSAGIPVAISSVIMKQNFHQLDEIIEQAYLLGAYRIILGEFMYAGRAIVNKDEIELTEEELFLLEKKIAQKQEEYSGKMMVIKAMDIAASLRYHIANESDFVLIRPNGDVRIDCQAPFKIGNILEEPIEEIWENIGYYVWQHPDVFNYVDQIKHEYDILNVSPRTHYDEDVLLKPIKNFRV